MGGTTPKPFLTLQGKPVLHYSLELFYQLPYICEVCVVCHPSWREQIPAAPIGSSVVLTFAEPGSRRQDSVYQGVQALTTHPSLVAIHDSARPLIDSDLVTRTVAAAAKSGAALCGVPVKGTIKIATTQGAVVHTPPRHLLWEAQTPQVIAYDLLQTAFQHPLNIATENTDDVTLLENMDLPVSMVMGSYANIKLTTTEDFAMAASLLL
jgi:2-C-methyl-D-erythritol 4-phosphate cytidylyltransferase